MKTTNNLMLPFLKYVRTLLSGEEILPMWDTFVEDVKAKFSETPGVVYFPSDEAPTTEELIIETKPVKVDGNKLFDLNFPKDGILITRIEGEEFERIIEFKDGKVINEWENPYEIPGSKQDDKIFSEALARVLKVHKDGSRYSFADVLDHVRALVAKVEDQNFNDHIQRVDEAQKPVLGKKTLSPAQLARNVKMQEAAQKAREQRAAQSDNGKEKRAPRSPKTIEKMRQSHAKRMVEDNVRRTYQKQLKPPESDRKWPFTFSPDQAVHIMSLAIQGKTTSYIASNPRLEDEVLDLVKSRKVLLETLAQQTPAEQKEYLSKLAQVWKEKYELP
jgi:hypothetical protein